MKSKAFRNYYILSLIGVGVAAFYPLYMGIRVVTDMLLNGMVLKEDYPKYIIPYTPISLAVVIGTLLLPLALKYAKRFALPAASALSLGVFFVSEWLLESQVIITSTVKTTLESWQMYMCYIIPEEYETRTWTAVDILMGEYSPAFKLHFYVIAIVLILSLLNSIYGFGKMIQSGDRTRKRPLILQAIASAIFLGLCIWACFTAFYRTGELQVSAISAILMGVFFVLMGLTMGFYVGSFLFGKNGWLSVVLPSVVSSIMTFVMYIGEMILLSGHLYRFGTGFFFDPLGKLVLAPVDMVIILLSGAVCTLVLWALKADASHVPDKANIAE